MAEQRKKDLALKGSLVSECMLSNSFFTIAGVAVGTYLGIRKKHLRPFVYSITFGTLADLVYGYTNSCRTVLDDYETAKLALTPKTKSVLVPVPPGSVGAGGVLPPDTRSSADGTEKRS
ncbi:hypothetical protein B484DRAFT_399391 [Ochromonadaceae sp. CCMP2298]|nr:hypothetical protein B484DRAFT_399391 [Ochromonadaceae sp. CCMP2298]